MGTRVGGTWLRVAAAAVAVLAASAGSRGAEADGPGEASRPRFNLTAAYTPGARFRVERSFRQSTVTIQPQGRIPMPPVDWSSYDASLEVSALVTVEEVTDKGEAQVWSARFDRLRVDVPDPLQSAEYRARQREQKQKGLPRNAHPLEGATVKFDGSGPKSRLYRVLDSGTDAGITQRYPEVLPLMQDLVDPDWSPVDTIPLFGEWEMNADHIFRLTRVLARAPLKGVIRCRLVSVSQDMALIDIAADLKESFAKVDMGIAAKGRIEFDVRRRRVVRSAIKGDVTIRSSTSSLAGNGTLVGQTAYTVVEPEGEAVGR